MTEFTKIALPKLLQILSLSNNKVSSVYQTLFNEIDLFELDIGHCKISIIPANIFSRQTRYRTLYLAFNEITYIMTNPFLSTLISLKLHNNRLSTLPHDIFDGFKILSDLSLHSNRLVTLPDFSSMSKLRYLRLSNNRLTIYPDSLKALSIKYLWLQNNKFAHFKNTFFRCNLVHYLDISGNKLYYLQNGLLDECLELRVLIGGDNEIRELPHGIFDCLQAVFKLSLKFNNLSMLHATVFHSMRSLQHLHLEGNNLVSLPVNIFTFNIKLRHLTLSWNKIFAIYPETFETLTKLEVLELEGTNLKDV